MFLLCALFHYIVFFYISTISEIIDQNNLLSHSSVAHIHLGTLFLSMICHSHMRPNQLYTEYCANYSAAAAICANNTLLQSWAEVLEPFAPIYF